MTNPTTIEEADIAKKAAEAAEAMANAKLALKEVELRETEIRKARAEASREEQQAMIASITLAERDRVEQLTKVQDFYRFTHYYDGPVTEKTVYNCLNTLNAWDRIHPDSAWHLIINSPGGYVSEGMLLFDSITAFSIRGGGKHHITMTVRGEAASMAGILLQAADERVMGAQSQLLIHQVSSWTQGNLGAIKDEVKRLDMLTDAVVDIFMDRAGKKISRSTFVKSWERRDWWLGAKEAVKLGFADRIG